jgi:hypothetical protein
VALTGSALASIVINKSIDRVALGFRQYGLTRPALGV